MSIRATARRLAAAVGIVIVAIVLIGAMAASAFAPLTARSLPVSATTTIATNWKAFFSGQTPPSKKIALLQNGPAFATIINAQSSSGIARSTTASVSKVTVNQRNSATVRYSILLAGTPALSNQSGTAVYQSGTWKVGTASFCSLLALEGTRPAACKRV